MTVDAKELAARIEAARSYLQESMLHEVRCAEWHEEARRTGGQVVGTPRLVSMPPSSRSWLRREVENVIKLLEGTA